MRHLYDASIDIPKEFYQYIQFPKLMQPEKKVVIVSVVYIIK